MAEVVNQWPNQLIAGKSLGPRDAVLVLTHDPKFDEPALLEAVNSGAGYIDALGSPRTVDERTRRVGLAGITEEQLDRIISRCGLDVGVRGPEETAISTLAEIISQGTGRSGGHLRNQNGCKHNRHGDVAVV